MTERLKDIDAVIFDMDGTLTDSMWVWVSVDEDYLKKYQLTKPPNFHEDMEGKSYLEVAQYYQKVFPSLHKSLDEIMEEWHDMAYEKYMHEVPLKKGVQEFIEKLAPVYHDKIGLNAEFYVADIGDGVRKIY